LLLFGFAVYIAYLVESDRILYYISPRMVLYVKLSALGLYAVGAYQLYSAVSAFSGKHQSCDCGHDHSHSGSPWKSTLVYGLFALPLLLGFLMPDTSLGSTLAAKKGMNLNSAAAVKTSSPMSGPSSSSSSATAASDARLEQLFPSEPFTEAFANHARKLYKLDIVPVPEELYIETLTTLDLYARQFTGKKVKLSGFVFRDETMNARQFVIGRFSVQCCSADAAPFGVLIESDRAGLYASDQWVEMTGTIGTTKFDGSELMVVKAEQIVKMRQN
ncbi:MAG: hypothetical protein K0R28_6872, partial [Paenibacillus sp.]|nr:hypothetical protein [Paenibacillus sp.]